jgi:hypothetical protein
MTCGRQDVSKKEEWYEHKMRLLKQDKRRRGETIGKLLRCLDDMKDHGRLDDSRVTEGRLVLAATMNSRECRWRTGSTSPSRPRKPKDVRIISRLIQHKFALQFMSRKTDHSH